MSSIVLAPTGSIIGSIVTSIIEGLGTPAPPTFAIDTYTETLDTALADHTTDTGQSYIGYTAATKVEGGTGLLKAISGSQNAGVFDSGFSSGILTATFATDVVAPECGISFRNTVMTNSASTWSLRVSNAAVLLKEGVTNRDFEVAALSFGTNWDAVVTLDGDDITADVPGHQLTFNSSTNNTVATHGAWTSGATAPSPTEFKVEALP